MFLLFVRVEKGGWGGEGRVGWRREGGVGRGGWVVALYGND